MEGSNTQVTPDMKNNEQIINKENNMNEKHEQETINQETTNKENTMPETNKPETVNQTVSNPNQEDNMTETNTEKTNTANIDIEKLKDLHSQIQKDYAGLTHNEKSSAAKSYDIGHNLTLLHNDNLYQQLSNHRGNPFKSWGDFCEMGCEFSRAYADKLMKSAAIQDELEQAGVTSIKQSVANLYALRKAKKNDPDLDLAEVWKKATDNAKKAFPSRKKVQEAIDMESHAPKKISQVKKGNNTPHDLTSLLTAIQAITLSDEDKQQVRQVLDALLKAEQEDSPETPVTAEPVKLSA